MLNNTNEKNRSDRVREFIDRRAYACMDLDDLFNIKRMNHKCALEFPELILDNSIFLYIKEHSKSKLLDVFNNINHSLFIEKLDVIWGIDETRVCVEMVLTYSLEDHIYRCLLKKTESSEIGTNKTFFKEDAQVTIGAKNKVFSNFSHEIRTPLNSIMGSLAILKDTELTLKQVALLNQSLEASRVLLAKVNDFLNIPNVKGEHMLKLEEKFDLRAMTESIVELHINKATEKGLELNLTIDEGISDFYIGDRKKINQVMMNLIDNAVKYTFEGSIDIKLMALVENTNVDKINFIVEDTGIGIDSEDLEEVFKPYDERLSKHECLNSSGIGLPICKELIQSLGGELIVDSHIGLGTKFEFVVPLVTSKIETSSKPCLLSFENKNIKAIILEDDTINQMIMTIRLEKLGIECDVAMNGKEGVEFCKLNEYDIIFMDCQMPIVDGYEATRQIRSLESYAQTPIFALTGHAFSGEREKAEAAGMNEYFTKPIDFKALIKMIHKYL